MFLQCIDIVMLLKCRLINEHLMKARDCQPLNELFAQSSVSLRDMQQGDVICPG